MTASPGMQLQWRHDENEIENIGTNLFIPSVQPTNVGRYSLRVTLGAVRFFTSPVEIQINSEGQTNVLAQDKLLDAPGSELKGSDGSGGSPFTRAGGPLGPTPMIGVVRGYTGSQIFDTTYATTDPNEPPHCSITGGSSYWLMYQPPTNGTITLDTIGSTYDTVMEAYTYNGTLTSYADLISLACDNDSVALHGAALIQFPVLKARQYLVVVDGVNGARGIAQLNYNLNTNQVPIAPTLQQAPSLIVVTNGWSGFIVAPVQGCPPMTMSWTKNGALLSGQKSTFLPLTNVTSNDSGDYTLNVTNDLGTLVATYPLHVVVPPLCALAIANGSLNLSWPTVAGQTYTIQEASSLSGPWKPWTNIFFGDGINLVVPLPSDSGSGFYRLSVR
jgi:hypothetical protein